MCQDDRQKEYERDLCLLVGKGLMPLSNAVNPYNVQLHMHLSGACGAKPIKPVSRNTLRHKLLPAFANEIKEDIVHPLLNRCKSVSLSFDLWMSRASEDVFALIAHFIDPDTWKAKHLSLGMVRAEKTDGGYLAEQLLAKLKEHNLVGKVIAYVKDQGSNLNTCTDSLEEALKKMDGTSEFIMPGLELKSPYMLGTATRGPVP